MLKHIALVVALVGCSKKDDCERAYDKMAPLMQKLKGPSKDAAADKDKDIKKCRDGIAKDPEAKKMVDCINGIDGDVTEAKLGACMGGGHAKHGGEAELLLNKIGKNAKRVFAETGSFPPGKSKQLPEFTPTLGAGCCGGKAADGAVINKCPTSTDWAKDPVWTALDFTVDEPSNYRYSYESDGKTFKATAVGDVDCDGTEATYTLDGRVDNGNPTVNLTVPPKGSY